jgi:DNA-nicking Smr family endonuclease
MARHRRPDLPDWHLWTEVAQTVTPLRLPAREAVALVDETLPIPTAPTPPKPRKLRPPPSLPAYRPDGRPGRPQPLPGTVIEPNLLRKLGRGRIGIDARIDLHGFRQSEAHAALTRFIHARSGRGDRTLLVITGKGGRVAQRDEDLLVSFEKGVLRAMLPLWLSGPDLAPLVAGWEVASRSHGGEGAYYVRLKPLGRGQP